MKEWDGALKGCASDGGGHGATTLSCPALCVGDSWVFRSGPIGFGAVGVEFATGVGGGRVM